MSIKEKKETLENLEEFELVIPARQILDAIIDSPDFLKPKMIDKKRAQELKIAISAQNALVGAFKQKTGYFRLIGTAKKLQYLKKKNK